MALPDRAIAAGQGALSCLLFGLQTANLALLRRCLGSMDEPHRTRPMPSEGVAGAGGVAASATAGVTSPEVRHEGSANTYTTSSTPPAGAVTAAAALPPHAAHILQAHVNQEIGLHVISLEDD